MERRMSRHSIKLTGWEDYNHAGGNQVVPATTWTIIDNDGAGPYTNLDHRPSGMDQLYDTVNECFNFEDAPVGAQMLVRISAELTPTVNNTITKIRLRWVAKDDDDNDLYTFHLIKKLPTLDEGLVAHEFIEEIPLTIDGEAQQNGDIFLEMYTSNETTINLHGYKVFIL